MPEKTDIEEYLVYRILDGLTDAFYPVIDAIEARVDATEREVLERPRQSSPRGDLPAQAGGARPAAPDRPRSATCSRRAGADVIASLPGLSRGSREYMRDVADHLAQVVGELTRQNEDLLALTSTYFNANANRLNRTASRLSVAGTFFIAWTLVTGFFGQNFGWLVDHINGERALPRLRHRRPGHPERSCSASTSGAAARTGSRRLVSFCPAAVNRLPGMSLGIAPRQADMLTTTTSFCEGRVAEGLDLRVVAPGVPPAVSMQLFADLFCDGRGRRGECRRRSWRW